MVNADTLQPAAIAISRLQSMHIAMSRMMHVVCASYDGTAIEPYPCAGYLQDGLEVRGLVDVRAGSDEESWTSRSS
jgi:hypothetical protein